MTVLAHDWFPRALQSSVSLGEGSWLYSSYAAHHNLGVVNIGAHCGIYDGSHFELGPAGRLTIGDYTTIVGAIVNSNGEVQIADHCFIAHEVFIAASAWALPPADASGLDAQPRGGADGTHPSIEIGSGAWIGTRAVILAPARIGRDAVIGAGAVICGTVPDGATATGNPMRIRADRTWPG